MHEIVTLQFGQHSHYVGTHFWNTQVRHMLSPSAAITGQTAIVLISGRTGILLHIWGGGGVSGRP